MARFDAERRGRLIAAGIGPLLERSRDLAGNASVTWRSRRTLPVEAFNRHAGPAEREALARFIAEEEDGAGSTTPTSAGGFACSVRPS